MDQNLRTDAQEAGKKPVSKALSFSLNREAVEARIAEMLAEDKHLIKAREELQTIPQRHASKIAVLEEEIRQHGIDRGNIINKVKSLNADAKKLKTTASLKARQVAKFKRRKPRRQIELEELIQYRSKLIKKNAIAKMQLEAEKDVRKSFYHDKNQIQPAA